MKNLVKIDLIGDPLIDVWNDGDSLNYCMGGAANVANSIISFLDEKYNINFNLAFKLPWIFRTNLDKKLFDTLDIQEIEDFPGKSYIKVEDRWLSKDLTGHPLDCKNVQISNSWYYAEEANYSILIISNYNKGFVNSNIEKLLVDKKYNICILDDRYAVTDIDLLKQHTNILLYRYTKHADKYIGDVWDYCLQTNGSEEVIFGNKEKEPLLKIMPFTKNPISVCGAGDVATASLAFDIAKSIYIEELKFLENNYYFSYQTLDDILCNAVTFTQAACYIATQKPYTCTIYKDDIKI